MVKLVLLDIDLVKQVANRALYITFFHGFLQVVKRATNLDKGRMKNGCSK